VGAETVLDLLAAGDPVDPLLGGLEQSLLRRSAILGQVEQLAGQLRGAGVEPGDRVAIVLPNGPEMALAFLGVACCAAAAPLNPAYREEEFRFYLEDLRPKALVVAPGGGEAARAALPAGAVVLELEGAPGGLKLTREGDPISAVPAAPPSPGQAALLLHTSGTTSRPKLVPLTQANLTASALTIASWLRLEPGDRCLNVMPLFHIHGLVAAVLASIAGRAEVICTPGFDAFRVLDWLAGARPTWYTAVPTMHQLILDRQRRQGGQLPPLRFVRSSSASLPPTVMRDLEAVFGAPVIEAYGMTEASHQMASNPLPPAERFPGSVGLATGIELAVVDAAGRGLPAGSEGEVVIRGPSVTAGYDRNPEANLAAFFDGWFRTGDLGALDSAGYLRLTGRLKEIINRGGEKVSPREVEEVLLQHEAVAQAAVFAVPHPKLGEEIGAALVLKPGTSLDEAGLRAFAAGHLADFKLPRTVVFLEEIPKGPTGKVQRIGLAERLGLAPPR
jgi:acyl-CoA synthetase (AMP-forming)/AMP-acid ligase II